MITSANPSNSHTDVTGDLSAVKLAGADSGTIDDKTLAPDVNWPSYSVVYALNVNDIDNSDDSSKAPIHSRCDLVVTWEVTVKCRLSARRLTHGTIVPQTSKNRM